MAYQEQPQPAARPNIVGWACPRAATRNGQYLYVRSPNITSEMCLPTRETRNPGNTYTASPWPMIYVPPQGKHIALVSHLGNSYH